MAEKKIGDNTYRVDPLLATKALLLQARVMRVVGPALSKFGEVMQGVGPKKTEEEKAKGNAAAIEAFASIFAQSRPEELAELIKDLCQVARIRRPSGVYDPVDFDGDMSDKQRDIIPLAVFVLREQFGDFFSGLPGLGSLVNQQAV